MKKRILSLLLAVCAAASLLVLPAGAAEVTRFSDVTDQSTAVAVESLRLMGVLDGYSDGSFRPTAALTRAQFCKMAVYAMNGESELGLYRTVTVFPDVKPSHWASSYINMAAKGKNIISGYPDGRFHPDRTVTVGQAVTILLRLLGYKDENVGGVWPDSYMAVGATIGLTDGVGTNGGAALTRAQAAQLFLNLLRADMLEGGSYLSTIGAAKADTVLVSATATGTDGQKNAIQTDQGETYQFASGKTSNGSLNGRKGTLVLNKQGKALTFVPDAAGSSRAITMSAATATQITDTSGVKYTVTSKTSAYYNGETSTWGNVYAWLHTGDAMTLYLDAAGEVTYVFMGGGGSVSAAVVVYDDRSSAGFDSLTGGTTNYALYKNGDQAVIGDLRKYDVATYDPATNAIRVCDTRVTVYYESCSPNPAEPSEITALGRTFEVLPTAMESVAQFKPGDQMTLLLTEGGQIAGAVAASGSAVRGNAVGIVRDGKVQLLCGTAQIEVDPGKTAVTEGQLVRVSSNQKGAVTVSRLSGGSASGSLDVSAGKLGGKELADSVMIFRDGESLRLRDLTSGEIPAGQITYARLNWAGKVDLIVLSGSSDGTVYYGRAVVREEVRGGVNGLSYTVRMMKIQYAEGKESPEYQTGYNIQTGEFVGATVDADREAFSKVVRLTEIKNVSNSAWSGQSAVTVGSRTYTVPGNVRCYNAGTKMWVTLGEAHAYAAQSTLYVEDGTVRVIKVG
nr:S-layer homology domain-containing protein [uncultured Oscillibacter sp.]